MPANYASNHPKYPNRQKGCVHYSFTNGVTIAGKLTSYKSTTADGSTSLSYYEVASGSYAYRQDFLNDKAFTGLLTRSCGCSIGGVCYKHLAVNPNNPCE